MCLALKKKKKKQHRGNKILFSAQQSNKRNWFGPDFLKELNSNCNKVRPHLLHLRLSSVDVVVQSLKGDLRLLGLSALPLKLLFTLENIEAPNRLRAAQREKILQELNDYFGFQFQFYDDILWVKTIKVNKAER